MVGKFWQAVKDIVKDILILTAIALVLYALCFLCIIGFFLLLELLGIPWFPAQN